MIHFYQEAGREGVLFLKPWEKTKSPVEPGFF